MYSLTVPTHIRKQYDYIKGIWKFFDYAFCGASLIQISPPVVLTAAHCVDDFMANSTHMFDDWGNTFRLYADINRTFAQNGPRASEVAPGDEYQTLEFDINSIVIHPQWNTIHPHFGFDIALIFFDNVGDNQTVDMADADLPSLPSGQLSSTTSCCRDDEELVAIGYGLNETNGSATATLEQTTLHFVPLDDCVDALTNTALLSAWGPDESVMCADKEGTDTCQVC